MRLTKQSGYALRIVMECASNGDDLTRIADIAEMYKITKNNIAKTVPILVRNGILQAVRGRNGGVKLAKPADQITIGEIVRASEATHVEADCFGGDAVDCPIRPAAPVNRMLDEALAAFIDVLDNHTVADMTTKRPGTDALARMAAGSLEDLPGDDDGPAQTPGIGANA